MPDLQPSSPVLTAAALGVLALGGVLIVRAIRGRARARRIADVPVSPAAATFVGWLEAGGTAGCDDPLASPLSGTPCVAWRLGVTEQYTRTVTETVRGAGGRVQTRTRVETGWQTVASEEARTRFRLEDASGSVEVDPENARVRWSSIETRVVTPADPEYRRFTDRGPVAGSDGRRRLVEEGIPVGARVHLVGHGRPTAGGADVEIGFDGSRRDWQGIAVGDAATIERWAASGSNVAGFFAWILVCVGTFLAARGLGVVEHTAGWRAGALWIGVGTAVALVIAAVTYGIVAYNGFVDLSQRARRAVARIDVELDRRAKLIPRLIEIARGARDHEREVQVDLAALRAEAGATREGQPGPDAQRVGSRVGVLAEAWPELGADGLFRDLHDRLVETEDRISYARSYLVELTASWRTRRERFPERVLFAWLDRRPEGHEVAQGFQREVPNVALRPE